MRSAEVIEVVRRTVDFSAHRWENLMGQSVVGESGSKFRVRKRDLAEEEAIKWLSNPAYRHQISKPIGGGCISGITARIAKCMEAPTMRRITSTWIEKAEAELDGGEQPYVREPERSASLKTNSARPFNAETPLDLLCATHVTQTELFYVRNHAAVPSLPAESYKLAVIGVSIICLTLHASATAPTCTLREADISKPS